MRLLDAGGGFLGLTVPVEEADKQGKDRPCKTQHTYVKMCDQNSISGLLLIRRSTTAPTTQQEVFYPSK